MKQKQPIPAGKDWREIPIREFEGSPHDRIGRDWMVIGAGNARPDGTGDWNAMTASWGGLGVLWGLDVAFMFIRPSRHTFGFANDNGLFSLAFFEEPYREALNLMGSKSGRDCDKAEAAGLTPVVFDQALGGGRAGGAIGFQEARDIILCRKLYTHDFEPRKFLDPDTIEKAYHGQDYHRMYIGEILTLVTRGAVRS